MAGSGDGKPGKPATGLRVLIAGGGTGGHVYPGLAVAEALLAAEPGAEVRFAGTRRGLEFLLVPKAGFRLHTVPASGFRGLGPLARLRFLVNFLAGLLCSLWLLLTWRPAVVLGTGGYVSAPVLAAARLLRLRCALQEQNAIPGSANRLLARWVEKIYLGFGEAAEFFPGRQVQVTGNPVRASFATGSAAAGSEKEVPPRLPDGTAALERRLLVFGGSRGARTLNRAVSEAAAIWRDQPSLVIWIQTGIEEKAAVAAAFADFPPGRVVVAPYLFDMPAALAWADLAVCRAGAMTLAELQVVGRAAVLVPYPHATDDHQLRNARACEQAGAAVVIEDDHCTGEVLAETVAILTAAPDRLAAMGQAAATLGKPGAAAEIARDLTLLAGLVPAGEEADVP